MNENTETMRWVKKTLLLDTDVPTFMTWLGEHLSEVSALRRFPADRGYFVLNELPVPWWTSPIPATRVIEIEGRRIFIEDGGEQDAIDTPWLIRLEVFRLNKDRTEVKAECREPSHGIRAYFDELTEAIEMRWSKLNESNARPIVNQTASQVPEHPETVKRNEEIMTLRRKGLGILEISLAVSTSESTVKRVLKKSGLSKFKKKRR